MGAIPTTVNEPARLLNKGIKALLDLGTGVVEKVLIGYAPWLSFPVIYQLFEYGMGRVEDEIYKALAEDGTLIVLKFQTAIEKAAYLDSIEKLKAAQAANDDAAIAAARKAWADATSSFIHSDGSATP